MSHSTLSKTQTLARPDLEQKPSFLTQLMFGSFLFVGLFFTVYSVVLDIEDVQVEITDGLPFMLLGIALLLALGFEFVNGFHDTANAVATVIYTHSMPPNLAVLWSGVFNFFGVLFSSGAVAFGIVALLPIELILHTGSETDFAMIFALLIAAVLWNLGTWWFGLPASSSHTLIGSLIGVNVADSLGHGRGGFSGIDWGQVCKVGYALLFSPFIGFICAALLFWLLKTFVKNKELYQEPVDNSPPPLWIRSLLILTCTGVSFVHGSNDGQKGMGLIMLILVGSVPLAYSFNRSLPVEHNQQFIASAHAVQQTFGTAANAAALTVNPTDELAQYAQTKKVTPALLPALAAVAGSLEMQMKLYGSINQTPTDVVSNVRSKMYLADETIRLLEKDKSVKLNDTEKAQLKTFKKQLDAIIKFIPVWVKVVVAIALGLGTLAGWKRVVITVGEKIGKSHMTYGQGAMAGLTAILTIGAADVYGLPVSTTQVVSSGIGGTMVANKSGLQMITLRNLLLAWVMTLPAAMLLSGVLYWLFAHLF